MRDALGLEKRTAGAGLPGEAGGIGWIWRLDLGASDGRNGREEVGDSGDPEATPSGPVHLGHQPDNPCNQPPAVIERRWARSDPIGLDEGLCVAAGREGEGERVRVCGDDWTVRGDVMAAWVGSSADRSGLGFGQTMLVRRIGNIWTVKMLSRGDLWKGIPKL
jgi:hypothetical protein